MTKKRSKFGLAQPLAQKRKQGVEIQFFHSCHVPLSYLITFIYSPKNTKISSINYYGPPLILLIPLAYKYFISHYLNWIMIWTITKSPKNSYLIQFFYYYIAKPKSALQAQCTHPILFKAQGYLSLAIFQKPIIQVHGNAILSMEFKFIIKAYGLNPWQFIYQKSNSHW